MTGLTHATGISFAPTEKWNLGINTDTEDLLSEADLEEIASIHPDQK